MDNQKELNQEEDKPIRKGEVLSKPYESAGETVRKTDDEEGDKIERVQDTDDEETEDAKAKKSGGTL